MLGVVDPNFVIGELGIAALVLAAFWYLIQWVRNAPISPDPWDAETEKQIHDATETCPHCSTPQPPTAWFCEYCGRAVGPYNNLMPYVLVFSEGEVLRNGTQDRLRKSPLIVLGYFLISFNFFLTAIISFRRAFIVGVLMLFCLALFWRAVFKNFYRPAEKPGDDQPKILGEPK